MNFWFGMEYILFLGSMPLKTGVFDKYTAREIFVSARGILFVMCLRSWKFTHVVIGGNISLKIVSSFIGVLSIYCLLSKWM